jgi:predicted nucleotidyltransferase
MMVDDVMLEVSQALDRASVPYMLVGAFSSNYHGIPRSTEDVDIVVELNRPLTGDFSKLLGDKYEAEPRLSFETNTGTQRQEFRVKGTLFKVELFRLSDDAFDQEHFRRRMLVDLDGRRVWMPTPEDVIVMKLRWVRVKDKEDVKDVISVQRDNLDWSYIKFWCKQHRSIELLETIRRSAFES